MCVCVLSRFSLIRLFATLWTVACQAPLSMGFSRQEYWSGMPFPPSGDLPNPEIEPESLRSLALAGRFFTTSATWEGHFWGYHCSKSSGIQALGSRSAVPTPAWVLIMCPQTATAASNSHA